MTTTTTDHSLSEHEFNIAQAITTSLQRAGVCGDTVKFIKLNVAIAGHTFTEPQFNTALKFLVEAGMVRADHRKCRKTAKRGGMGKTQHFINYTLVA